ncbi:MAG: NADP oxidoreductase [Bryobacteraceae bacterium]
MRKTRLATVWLDGCSGCHMSLLDLDEMLIPLAGKIDIVYGPLVDAQEFPKAVDVTVVEGAVSSRDDLEKIRLVRQRSKLVVALGDCAVTSNVPAMRNGIRPDKLLRSIYETVPTDGVPALLKHAVPVHDAIKVDLHVPGCPPAAKAIGYVLGELLEGRIPELSGKVKFG